MLNLNYWWVVLNIMTAVLLELASMVVGTDSEIINLPCCWSRPVWSFRTLITYWQTSGETLNIRMQRLFSLLRKKET